VIKQLLKLYFKELLISSEAFFVLYILKREINISTFGFSNKTKKMLAPLRFRDK